MGFWFSPSMTSFSSLRNSTLLSLCFLTVKNNSRICSISSFVMEYFFAHCVSNISKFDFEFEVSEILCLMCSYWRIAFMFFEIACLSSRIIFRSNLLSFTKGYVT